MPSGTTEVTEARIAVARSLASTRGWYSFRVNGTAGDIGIVLPVSAGAQVDFGLPSFLDALEAATSPRVVPPGEDEIQCAASSGKALVETEGDFAASAAVAPAEAEIIDSVDGVRQWATTRGLTISPTLDAKLVVSGASHFVVARYAMPAGLSRTRPLRVVTPGDAPSFPLDLVEAGTEDVSVHAFAIGRHRATLSGSTAALDLTSLSFDAAAVSSNYEDLVADALGPPGTVLIEGASHAAWRDSVSVGVPSADPIDSVIKTYFTRAATTGEATLDADTCIGQSAVILGQSAGVGSTCPRATVGVAGGGAACTDDTTGPGQVDPELLRCGGLADDVAVALSELEPDEAWITRGVLRIPAANAGPKVTAAFPGGEEGLSPVVEAAKLDLSGCGEGGSGAGGASTGPSGSTGSSQPPPATSGGGRVEVPVYAHDGCSCDGSWVVVDTILADESTAPDGYYESGDSCSGDTTPDTSTGDTVGYESSPTDECSGDTTTSDSSLDGCSCDGTTDSGDSYASDACGGDSSSSDSCGGDSGSNDGCSGDSSCTAARTNRGRPRIRRYKVSVFVYGFLFVVIPLRRLGRKKRLSRAKRARQANR